MHELISCVAFGIVKKRHLSGGQVVGNKNPAGHTRESGAYLDPPLLLGTMEA